MEDLERILKIAEKNKHKSKDGKIGLIQADFIDLINSRGRIICLNREFSVGYYRHEAEYSGFVFKTITRKKIYDL